MNIIKGNTLKKQMESVDKILKAYSYRLRKTATGFVTPFPISKYSDLSGTVLRYMFPIGGKITVGGVYIEEMPKSGVDIKVTVCSGPLCDSKSVTSKKNPVAVMPDFEVFPGTRLVVEISPANDKETASGIWIAFLWVPKVKDTEIKQFLVEDLMKIEESKT